MGIEIKRYNKNEIIFREGVQENWMFNIESGRVGIYANYGGADEKLLADLGANHHFGELGLFGDLPRFNTVVALEDDVAVAVVSLDNLAEYAREHPGMLLSVMHALSMHTRILTESYAELCRSIAEAAENARQNEENSKGLKSRLARFMREVVKPCFTTPVVNYDIDAYMASETHSTSSRRRYNAKSVVFCQGDSANCMYDVRQGSVGIYSDYGKSSEKLLATLRADDYFGEMGMIDEEARSATAVALEDDTELELITAASFAQYLQERPLKVMMILQHMGKRLTELVQDYTQACKEVATAENSRNHWLSEHFNKYAQAVRN